MNFLEERILKDGKVKAGGVLKVGGFLNHLIDITLMNKIGEEFKRRFEGQEINKILTIEASGIAIAAITANYFNVPVLFAKKTQTVNLDDEIYSAQAYSFTHKRTNTIVVQKQFLSKGDRVLIIDDFLANGEALMALTSIVEQAGAEVCGIGIAIEKGMQPGGDKLRSKGFKLESIAIIDTMDSDNNSIKFREQ